MNQNIFMCCALISSLFVKAAEESNVPEVTITNATTETIWANVNGQTALKKFVYYKPDGSKLVKKITVPDYQFLLPQTPISYKSDKATEKEGGDAQASITFLRIKKKEKYMIDPHIIAKALSVYIKPLMNQYGIIWPSSDSGYSILSKPDQPEIIKATPATTDVPDKWLGIEIPIFETFTKEVPYKLPIVTYKGWNAISMDVPLKATAPIKTKPTQPVSKKPTSALPKMPQQIKLPKVKLPQKPKLPFAR